MAPSHAGATSPLISSYAACKLKFVGRESCQSTHDVGCAGEINGQSMLSDRNDTLGATAATYRVVLTASVPHVIFVLTLRRILVGQIVIVTDGGAGISTVASIRGVATQLRSPYVRSSANWQQSIRRLKRIHVVSADMTTGRTSSQIESLISGNPSVGTQFIKSLLF